MPNGVSCAYFAARNHVYGQKEDNPFKKGIAGIQSVRTVDAIVQAPKVVDFVSKPVNSTIQGLANFGKRIVYPLIIGSGIYNTVKSDDKIKTGASQALGISTMYIFETLAEKGLKKIAKYLSSFEKYSKSNVSKGLWYLAKGATFITASLAGFDVGSKISDTCVDKIRGTKKNSTQKCNLKVIDTTFPLEDGLKESQIFADMKL